MMKLRPILIETILSSKTWYHGTNKKFNKFEYTDALGNGGEMLGKGIYLTDNLDYAKDFGDNVLKCKIKATNPIDLTKAKEGMFDDFLPLIKDDNGIEYVESCLRMRALVTAFRKIRQFVSMEQMEKLGYDCVISWADAPSGGGIEVAVFDPKNIEIL